MNETGRHILIVDDDPDFAESLGDLFELQGHTFAIATQGEQALQLASEQTFDFVFLDIKMPGIDGVETLRRLRATRQDTKVAVITGYATDEQLDGAIAAGAFTVLEKPCPFERMLEVMKHAGAEQIVLVADDDPDFTDNLEELLPAPGRQVIAASSAHAALDLLEQQPVSVLLLDMRLPNTDGYKVLAALRERNLAVPVIVVTSYPFEETELRRFENSVVKVLQKPVPVRRLVEEISAATFGSSVQGEVGRHDNP